MTRQLLRVLKNRRMTLGPAGNGTGDFQHWRLSRDKEEIAWLILDKRDASVNTLSTTVLEELAEAINELEQNPPQGLVIRSAKPAGFCAGADIREFKDVKDQQTVRRQIEKGNEILNRLERLGFPTIAVIHGHCLGGGLELALACHFRIAIDGAKFGFPEVQLGLHPGLGGTARLTHLIDPTEAMRMMLTGKSAHTTKAKELGIVDAIAQERHVENGVRAAIAGELAGAKQGLKNTALNIAPARTLASRQMRSKSEVRAKPDHYPAPYALIDLWREHGGDRKVMQKAETQSFAELMFSDTARNLIRVYFLREKLRKFAHGDHDFAHVHVIGAGAMGGDIAGWCAIKGFRTTLSDVDNEMMGDAVKRTAEMAQDRHLESAEIRDALDRLIPDPDNLGVKRADVIIEAAPEKADLKEKIYKDIETRMKDRAILATNTSSIPLETLANALADPSHFVGIHFFNPVARMDLVEMVSHDGANEESLGAARAFLGRIDKLPAPVKSAPGFLVNRSLTPYLLEAIIMLDEGVKAETIDLAAERFGMPMGPVEVADQVGLDICLGVADVLREKLDTPVPDVPEWVRTKVEHGDVGRKSGRGFYKWKDGKANKEDDVPEPDEHIDDRLILPMLNACAACLREGVVKDEETLDAAMIFATGFAPFRGGPMHYAKKRGFDDIMRTLDDLSRSHGERFNPDPFWRERSAD